MALIKCPECGKQVSDKAQSCPNCGYPLKAEIKNPPSFTEDFTKVKKAGWWVALLLSLSGLGLPTLLGKLISPGTLGGSETEKIWTLFVLTAPLTCAVGIYSALLFNRSFRDMTTNGYIHLFIPLAIFVGTAAISSLFDPQTPIKLHDLGNQNGLYGTLAFILKTYFKAYGAWNFLCSVAVGVFLGWTWEKLFAHARRRMFRRSPT